MRTRTADGSLDELVELQLRRADLRYTEGRRRIVDILAGSEHPVSFADMMKSLRTVPKSSAYRHLLVLEGAGIIRRMAPWTVSPGSNSPKRSLNITTICSAPRAAGCSTSRHRHHSSGPRPGWSPSSPISLRLTPCPTRWMSWGIALTASETSPTFPGSSPSTDRASVDAHELHVSPWRGAHRIG